MGRKESVPRGEDGHIVGLHRRPAAPGTLTAVTQSAVATGDTPPGTGRRGIEVLVVLGVSLGAAAIFALLSLVRAQLTVKGGISHAAAPVITSQATQSWLDLAFQLAGIITGVMPALLALLLLSRDPAKPGFGIGWTRERLGRALAQGAGFALLVGIPGLGVVYLARRLGVSAQIVASTLPDVWWRIPVSLLSAVQNGFNEEIIIVGYLLTRFGQLRWGTARSITVSAVIRGSYHLYQGLGGFVGNLLMGLLFGWWFTRTRRVIPLVVAHSLLDAASFIGYVYLAGKISWL